MSIVLNAKKSIEQNAEAYFEKAKKLKQKMQGAKEALERFAMQKEKLLRQQASAAARLEQPKRAPEARQKQWYEKFRWFFSSDGFLCIGGRDAASNDIVVKKHAQQGDLVFHTEVPGSPFFVVKAQGRDVPEATREETAQAAASFSKGWKLGISSMEAFSVTPEQVTKEAKAGEYLGRGAFMIYGRRTAYHPTLELAIGIMQDSRIMCAPLAAVRKHCTKYAVIKQSNDKPSDTAKQLQKFLGAGSIDEIIAALPGGGCRPASVSR